MKKALAVALLTAWIFTVTAPFTVYAQGEKTADPPEKPQGAVPADNDEYIIGPEDVLLIHVWKEEAFTKTLPVRIDGKISCPL